MIGALGGDRTHDPRFRKPILYPTELRAHKLRPLSLTNKHQKANVQSELIVFFKKKQDSQQTGMAIYLSFPL